MLSGVFFLLRFWKSGSMIDKTSLAWFRNRPCPRGGSGVLAKLDTVPKSHNIPGIYSFWRRCFVDEVIGRVGVSVWGPVVGLWEPDGQCSCGIHPVFNQTSEKISDIRRVYQVPSVVPGIGVYSEVRQVRKVVLVTDIVHRIQKLISKGHAAQIAAVFVEVHGPPQVACTLVDIYFLVNHGFADLNCGSGGDLLAVVLGRCLILYRNLPVL